MFGRRDRNRISGPSMLVLLILAYEVLAGASPSNAQEVCIDYRECSRWLGQIDAECEVLDIASTDSLAIVAAGKSGLIVVDIRDLNSARVIGSLSLPGYARHLATKGPVAYVGCDSLGITRGIAAVSITDPASPKLLEFLRLDNVVFDMSISGSYLYVAAGSSGLVICDASDPNGLEVRGRLPMLAMDVWATGQKVFVTGDGLRVVDATDVDNLVLLGYLETPENWGIAFRAPYAYLVDHQSGFRIVDVSDPEDPRVVGTCKVPGTPMDIVLVDPCAYVAGFGSAPVVVNIENPMDPQVVGTLNLSSDTFALYCLDSLLFMASGDQGIQLFDVRTPQEASVLGRLDPRTYGAASGIDIVDGLAAVADVSGNLDVIDVHDPARPVLLSTCWLPRVGCTGFAEEVILEGSLAYVTNGEAGLKIVDLSIPSAPRIVGAVQTPGFARDVALSGTRAVVADMYFGMVVIDVTSPTSPTLLGSLNLPDYCRSVALSGDYAYIAANEAGIHIVNISDAAHPVLASTFDTPGPANNVLVSGAYAYVTGQPGYLAVLDITEPSSPRLLRTGDHYRLRGDLAMAGHNLYVCDGWGVQAFDVSDPEHPLYLGGRETPGSSAGLALEGGCVFVADWESSLTVLPMHCLSTSNPTDHNPRHAILGPGFPNPFVTGSATIPFTLSMDEFIRIRVLDVLGRQVRLLADNRFTQGPHAVLWDGRTDRGDQVPSGTYLYQLESPGFSISRRLVKLR